MRIPGVFILLLFTAPAIAQAGGYTITYYPNGDSIVNAEAQTDTIYPCDGWTGIGRFVDGKKEGWWQYFCNRVPMYSGTYRNGKKEGKWIMEWSGSLQYKNDLLDGEAVYYHVGTTIIEQERHYVSGKANGDWYVYDLNGKVIETRHYLDDKPVGIWEMHEGDIVRKGTVNEYGYHGKWEVTFHDTVIGGGSYINGMQDGNWIDVYVRAVYDSGYFDHGKKQGVWKSYGINGLYRSTQFVDGERNGSDTSWNNGVVSAIYEWKRNQWTGVNVIYYPGQTIKEQNTFEKKSGTFIHTEYYENGRTSVYGKHDINPDYIIYQAQLDRSCLGIPFEYDFELMERGLCFNSCVLMGHDHPTITLDSVASYLRSDKFRADTAGPHRPFGTPQFIRTGTWTFYWENGHKKEEGVYLPIVKGVTYIGELTYPKTGWWKVYDEEGKLLREELYDNGTLKQTKERKK